VGVQPLKPNPLNVSGRIERSLQNAQALVQRHSRGLATTAAVLMTGFAATAFGIAPLAPDAADLPQRTIVEPVVPKGIEAQLDALAAHALELSRNDLTRASDTADSLLRRLGVVDVAAAAFLRADPTARRLLEGRTGKLVQARAAADGTLLELVARYPAERPEDFATHFTRLTVARNGASYDARIESAPLSSQSRLASGTIETSLWAAADAARLPDTITVQLAEIFSTDIDFHRELRRGDTFSLVYEALTADGEPVTWNQGTGRVLAAEFVGNGRTYEALWFRGADGRGGYFAFDGQSKRRAFLASPMEFSRVSSGFAMRFHPILQTWRRHLGVDYAAPTGTPVRSVGDGTVEFAGRQNGYGNVVQLRHSNDRTTLYAHLSRIDVREGQRVEQGQRIGAVGATGWATGPHLHFEFRVNGVHQDPKHIARHSDAVPLTAEARPAFDRLARAMRVQLAAAASSAVVARAD
jgi:murein DD-endopeptidase MepM/ murein hydrolase activator NlpD